MPDVFKELPRGRANRYRNSPLVKRTTTRSVRVRCSRAPRRSNGRDKGTICISLDRVCIRFGISLQFSDRARAREIQIYSGGPNYFARSNIYGFGCIVNIPRTLVTVNDLFADCKFYTRPEKLYRQLLPFFLCGNESCPCQIGRARACMRVHALRFPRRSSENRRTAAD